MNKKELRKTYLQKRLSLSESEHQQLCQHIALKLSGLDLSHINYLHVFIPIIEKREVDTIKLVEQLKLNHPSIQFVVPQSNFDTHTLVNYLWDEHTVFEKNKWDITEPIAGTIIEPERIDMVFIPLLAFDKRGYRVGYGKGFYDRFLSQCRTNVQKVGIALFGPVDEISDTDQYDIKMDQCISPQQLYHFEP